MTQSGYISDIVKCRTNILDIFKIRGFDTSSYEYPSISDVNAMVINDQLDMLIYNETTGQKAYIKFHLAKKLQISNVRDYIEDLFIIDEVLTQKDDLFIISKNESNDSIKKHLQEIWEKDHHYISIIALKSLKMNILNHHYQPKFKVLTEDESNQVYKTYNITNKYIIPEIGRFDPVSLVLGIRPGQLCEILRPSKTAITAPYYRICSS